MSHAESREDWHARLDCDYGPQGDSDLQQALGAGLNPDSVSPQTGESLLHVAARRYRTQASKLLAEAGADTELTTPGGKTAWTHARRRGFTELTRVLESFGCAEPLNDADRVAVLISDNNLEAARKLLEQSPNLARTGNPEEDRLLPDIAGRFPVEPVSLLLDFDADLTARGLDDGTALHVAAWFGAVRNVRQLIAAGSPLNLFDNIHDSSPLHWAVHGARFSGGAEKRQAEYAEITTKLLEAGSTAHYPDDDGDSYRRRLFSDATPAVSTVLKQFLSEPPLAP